MPKKSSPAMEVALREKGYTSSQQDGASKREKRLERNQEVVEKTDLQLMEVIDALTIRVFDDPGLEQDIENVKEAAQQRSIHLAICDKVDRINKLLDVAIEKQRKEGKIAEWQVKINTIEAELRQHTLNGSIVFAASRSHELWAAKRVLERKIAAKEKELKDAAQVLVLQEAGTPEQVSAAYAFRKSEFSKK